MLIFIGDVHADFEELVAKLIRVNVRDSSFIQVGDFGLGFKKEESESNELTILNNFLEANNNRLFVIRGNHDNPKYFGKPSGHSNIFFLEDYTLLELEGKTILLAGGAVSWNSRLNFFYLTFLKLSNDLGGRDASIRQV